MAAVSDTLDYACQTQRARRFGLIRRYVRRIALASLMLACLVAIVVTWLYLGWRAEQPAIARLRDIGAVITVKPIGYPPLDWLLGRRSRYLRDRADAVDTYVYGSRVEGIEFNRLTHLTTLDLASAQPSAGVFTNLSNLHELRHLGLFGNEIGAQSAANLGALGQLTDLDLGFTNADDAVLAKVGRLVRLKTLRLCGTHITDFGLVSLESLANLEYLDLRGTAISGAGFVHLTRLQRLRSLSISYTRVNDQGLANLHAMTWIADVGLSAKGVTPSGVDALKKAIPGVIVRAELPP